MFIALLLFHIKFRNITKGDAIPRIISPKPKYVLVVFADDVKTEAMKVVQRIRSETGFETLTVKEIKERYVDGRAEVDNRAEAVNGAIKLVVIPSPMLFQSDNLMSMVNMAMVPYGKVVPIFVRKCTYITSALGSLTPIDLTQDYGEESFVQFLQVLKGTQKKGEKGRCQK